MDKKASSITFTSVFPIRVYPDQPRGPAVAGSHLDAVVSVLTPPMRQPMSKNTLHRGPACLAAAAALGSLAGCSKAVVLNPAGDIAAQQGHMVIQATLLMLIIIVPVIA